MLFTSVLDINGDAVQVYPYKRRTTERILTELWIMDTLALKPVSKKNTSTHGYIVIEIRA